MWHKPNIELECWSISANTCVHTAETFYEESSRGISERFQNNVTCRANDPEV